jgi:hypothetical protein
VYVALKRDRQHAYQPRIVTLFRSNLRVLCKNSFRDRLFLQNLLVLENVQEEAYKRAGFTEIEILLPLSTAVSKRNKGKIV